MLYLIKILFSLQNFIYLLKILRLKWFLMSCFYDDVASGKVKRNVSRQQRSVTSRQLGDRSIM